MQDRGKQAIGGRGRESGVDASVTPRGFKNPNPRHGSCSHDTSTRHQAFPPLAPRTLCLHHQDLHHHHWAPLGFRQLPPLPRPRCPALPPSLLPSASPFFCVAVLLLPHLPPPRRGSGRPAFRHCVAEAGARLCRLRHRDGDVTVAFVQSAHS